METTIYTQEGKKAKTFTLPEEVFGVKWNGDLVAQVIAIQAGNKRAGTAHTKDRGEVSGGGKKPWQQKGTGRARHGSSRSPIWRHGGVTHGPRVEKSYKRTLSPGMRNSALMSLLSAKFKDGKILFVDTVALKEPKTKEAEGVMKALSNAPGFSTLSFKKKGNVMMVAPKTDDKEKRAFRNLPYVTLSSLSHLSPLEVANTRYVVIASAEESVSYLKEKKA